jgi:exonuclease SbcD
MPQCESRQRDPSMRFLHAADLHVDSPLRGLDRYAGAPVERLRTATRQALERLVDKALEEAVDFVLLAGDIYDRDWQDFHTGLFFREQMVRLGRAEIPVFIIHGNHDAQGVISRQLTLPPNVTVFSSRVAQTHRLEELSVAIHGRSFRNRAEDADLVPSYPDPVPGWFNIGLLHTSLTGRTGHDPYAPTDRARLVEKGYDYWALGHVHAREVVAESPRIVFPGNLQGRHANETGPKGCELVNVTAGRIEAEFVPLDVVRWGQVTVSLDGIDRLDVLGDAFRAALESLLAGAGDRLHAVRVSLTGQTALYALEAEQPGTLDAAIRAAAQDLAAVEVWIEQVRLDLATPLDRVQAAERRDAVGELVRLVDAIGADPSALDALIRAELGSLLAALPPEVAATDVGEVVRLDTHEARSALLRDAEATVLARLAASGTQDGRQP